MHGFIDSISIPLHLPAPAPAVKQNAGSKGKGKEKEVVSQDATYNVVNGWTAEEKDDVERKIQIAALLGYSTVVLILSIPSAYNPANLSFPTPLFPLLDPRTCSAGTQGLVLQLWRIEVNNYDEEAVKGAAVKGIYGFTNATAPLYHSTTSLLSVAPTSLFSFSHCCLSLSPPSPFAPSIISFDPSLSARLPFPLKRGPVNTAQRAGLQFELIYRGMTKQDDPGVAAGSGNRRRNWIAGAKEIVRATGGVGVIISSGAVKAGEMRAAEDMINLCTLIGLTPAQAKDALTVNPQKAIVRGLSMRQSYRGVVSNPTITTTTTNTSKEKVKRSVEEVEVESAPPNGKRSKGCD